MLNSIIKQTNILPFILKCIKSENYKRKHEGDKGFMLRVFWVGKHIVNILSNYDLLGE